MSHPPTTRWRWVTMTSYVVGRKGLSKRRQGTRRRCVSSLSKRAGVVATLASSARRIRPDPGVGSLDWSVGSLSVALSNVHEVRANALSTVSTVSVERTSNALRRPRSKAHATVPSGVAGSRVLDGSTDDDGTNLCVIFPSVDISRVAPLFQRPKRRSLSLNKGSLSYNTI